jgi:hypothetical protein
MKWRNKAIEIRNIDSGTSDGVFMHKRSQKLKRLFILFRKQKQI